MTTLSETECATPAGKLTQRERDVLEDAMAGWSRKEIVARRGIARHTVNNHLRSAFRKLRVHSVVQAIWAMSAEGRGQR